MRSGQWAASIAFVTVVVLSAASTAQGQVVTFSGINDAVPAKFFDAATTRATTAPDPLDANKLINKLIIGFNTGMDWTTWKATEFRASTAAYSYVVAMDTISFRVEAPAGFYIWKITYTQRGTGSIARTGKAYGGATWVVGDYGGSLGYFGTNPTLSQTVDLTGLNMTFVPVSITSALFAYATPYLGSASVEVTGAEVLVELKELPPAEEPPPPAEEPPPPTQ